MIAYSLGGGLPYKKDRGGGERQSCTFKGFKKEIRLKRYTAGTFIQGIESKKI